MPIEPNYILAQHPELLEPCHYGCGEIHSGLAPLFDVYVPDQTCLVNSAKLLCFEVIMKRPSSAFGT